MVFSGPRLYLANGVTTMRTTGTVNPYADLMLKKDIEGGIVPGPHMDVTGPYLNGASNGLSFELKGPEDARQTVAFWADRGVTSFKAYKNITREELAAAVKEAHKRGLKVTVTSARSLTRKRRKSESTIRARILRKHGARPEKKPDKCSDKGATTRSST
jgi:imidazolonepropionase-like amidohydrolase